MIYNPSIGSRQQQDRHHYPGNQCHSSPILRCFAAIFQQLPLLRRLLPLSFSKVPMNISFNNKFVLVALESKLFQCRLDSSHYIWIYTEIMRRYNHTKVIFHLAPVPFNHHCSSQTQYDPTFEMNRKDHFTHPYINHTANGFRMVGPLL